MLTWEQMIASWEEMICHPGKHSARQLHSSVGQCNAREMKERWLQRTWCTGPHCHLDRARGHMAQPGCRDVPARRIAAQPLVGQPVDDDGPAAGGGWGGPGQAYGERNVPLGAARAARTWCGLPQRAWQVAKFRNFCPAREEIESRTLFCPSSTVVYFGNPSSSKGRNFAKNPDQDGLKAQ